MATGPWASPPPQGGLSFLIYKQRLGLGGSGDVFLQLASMTSAAQGITGGEGAQTSLGHEAATPPSVFPAASSSQAALRRGSRFITRVLRDSPVPSCLL